jgi:hypothetical protein
MSTANANTMKTYLMKKFGPYLGLVALVGIIIGYTLLPTSCGSLTAEQQKRLQAITVPAASIGLTIAQQKGWIEPGDKVTLQRGIAIVTSPGDSETKIFELAELGLAHAMKDGVLSDGDVLKIENAKEVSILSQEGPSGPMNPLLPPPN